MKRDMDLIRQILLQTEATPELGPPVEVAVEGFSDEEIAYHVMILGEAGYIKALKSPNWKPTHKPIRLTWEGHEFLDAARNETIWNKAKTLMKERGGGMAFEVLKTFLIEAGKRQVLDSLGLGSTHS